ncbi:MAG: adenylate kinase [Gammaproteobacteria bacterium]
MAELRLVFLGAPGCGKGTQAERIAARLGIPAISTGAMLRSAVAAGTALGERVARIMTAGDLVDDRAMAEVVRDRLVRPDARRGFILDGYPRTLVQAATLDDILASVGGPLDVVVRFEVLEGELIRRALARGRADDGEEVVRTRLAVYREKTEPLIAHYRERGVLREIDGSRGVEEVTDEILGVLAVEV